MKLGVERGKVVLVEYNPMWMDVYEAEKRILIDLFKDELLQIEHVGSTSIPGLKAKPLIDIALLVSDLKEVELWYGKLLKLHYIERVGRLEGKQRVFAKTIDTKITHHLHIIEEGEKDWSEKLKFKETLINNPNLVEEYTVLKTSLYQQFKSDRIAYTNGKAAFIQKVLNGDL